MAAVLSRGAPAPHQGCARPQPRVTQKSAAATLHQTARHKRKFNTMTRQTVRQALGEIRRRPVPIDRVPHAAR